MNLRHFLSPALLCVAQLGSAQIDSLPTAEGQPTGVGRAADPYKVHPDVRPKILLGPYIRRVSAWLRGSAGFQVCRVAGFQTRFGRLGSRRHCRFGNLRYNVAACVSERYANVVSEPLPFKTWDLNQASVTFVSVSDTHEDAVRIADLMKLVDWSSTDFLVQTGDAFNDGPRESIVEKWLKPLFGGMTPPRPLICGRGNHDTRGTIARELLDYVPTREGRFYYTRDIGPMHLLVVDNGEDKPDRTNVYAGLNDMTACRNEELAWFKEHMKTSARAAQAPFRVAFMHQPNWAPMLESEQRDAWNDWANAAKIDLVVAGHTHRFAHRKPGQPGNNNYHVIVVGQNQLGRFTVAQSEIAASVRNRDGSLVHETTIARVAGASGR